MNFWTASISQITSAIQRRFGITQLRPFQQEAIASIVKGQHTVVIAPTGQGKSLIYSIVPDLLGPDSITLVFAPLKSIIRGQIAYFTSVGILYDLTPSTMDIAALERVSSEL